MAPLDPRAILAGRTHGRPPIGVILTIAVSSACLLVALGFMSLEGPSFVVGLLLALLPLPLLLAGVLALDRLEPEPPDALVLAFLWGAGISVLVAMFVNTLTMTLVTEPLFGPEGGRFVSATFGAPVVEETLKGAVLFGMLWFRRHEINGPTDGIIYASMVGLGFATVENVSYYAATAQTGELSTTFVLRGVLTPLLHPLCTSLTGIGIAAAAQRRPGAGRLGPPLLGLLGAMTLHGLWNGSTAFGLGALALAYLVGAVVLVALLSVVLVERRRTVALIGRHLPRYAPLGVVSEADLRMLTHLPTRRAARTWARAAGGRGAARAMSDYQQAATELAMLHQRAERGGTDASEAGRRREALLGLMHAARQAFLRAAQPPPGDRA
ncbi:PrsW family intramembrane metalloprotease [Xylanimonas oleitrophica]|uniref:PrsW family intramembrane metalloprotease n=1 Tax=Xylanimonas oleitrophica TaxID=2607479 RepID=A0A2W5YD33_9MICO|nr:PrsW family intramembrane metalloprotease [Xylanimonas oleitrophica]PZR52171.1 PrsW family intramembrane metalloprotease [Xylanimonas oleitrophica]